MIRWGRRALFAVCLAVALLGSLYAFQKPFKEFSGTEYYAGDIPLPADWKEKSEFAFARLMFPGGPLDGYQRTGRFTGDYHFGLSLWTQDYPRADRHFIQAVRRLSRIDVRSVEQVVDVEDDDVFNWPFLYAVQAGEWGLTEKQGQRLREYLDRGGFFIGDDIHGPAEWGEWERRIKYAYPDRQMVDIPNEDGIFHTVYDLNDRQIIVGRDHLREGSKNGGTVPRWIAIYDDKNRIVVAGWFNQDTGDSWEWADDPYYPEKFSAQGIRQGLNYIIYAMTH